MSDVEQNERLRRWRLILGGGPNDGTGAGLSGDDQRLDGALQFLYERGQSGEQTGGRSKRGGMGGSQPSVARWLGDIRSYFPSSVVKVMQQDAFERLGLRQMLLEPEMMAAVEPDIHLVTTLLSLKSIMPQKSRETARLVVRRVVEDLIRKVANPTRQAVMGSLNRAVRNLRPRYNEIDWHRTIRTNLRHYQPRYRTIIPETRIGYGRKRSSLRDIVLCLDQSGSMATSVVYAGIFGAVLASLPAVTTHVVAYDTAVVDLTDQLQDPVDVLFGTQLGGGTDTARALGYCQGLIRRPQETIFVLISDLYEGGNNAEMLRQLHGFAEAGVTVVILLALADDGRPSYHHENAATLAGMGIPVFACTPDLFPDLMAAAINKQDLSQWAAAHDIVTAAAEQ